MLTYLLTFAAGIVCGAAGLTIIACLATSGRAADLEARLSPGLYPPEFQRWASPPPVAPDGYHPGSLSDPRD